MDSDAVGTSLGDFGRWQLGITFLLSLLNLPCTFHIFAPTFQSASPDSLWCARPSKFANIPSLTWINLTAIDGDACLVKVLPWSNISTLGQLEAASLSATTSKNCPQFEFDTEQSGNTIISQWSLVCNNKEWANVADMLFLFGVAVGGISGSLSDKFGRKRLVLISLGMQASLGLALAFNPYFYLYLAMRALLGFFSVSIVFSGFVLCMELVGGRWLTISGVCYLMPVPLGYILMSGIAFLIRDWNQLQLAISTPSVVFFFIVCFLPESPRWLHAMGRKEELMQVLTSAAKFNNKEPPSPAALVSKEVSKEESRGEGSITYIATNPELRKTTLILTATWFSLYFLYYGLTLNLSHLGGNVYINTVLSGGLELAAIAVTIPVLLQTGRRMPVCLSLSLGGVACLITLFLTQGEDWALGVAMVAKFAASSANVMVPVYTAELFPTLVRNLGIGICNIASGAALLFIPYLWNMVWMGAGAPMCVLGLTGLIGGLLVLCLPETKEKLSDNQQV